MPQRSCRGQPCCIIASVSSSPKPHNIRPFVSIFPPFFGASHMIKRLRLPLVVIFQMLSLLFACPAFGQQTLGGLTGVITDSQGGILPGTTATIVGEQTGVTRSQ